MAEEKKESKKKVESQGTASGAGSDTPRVKPKFPDSQRFTESEVPKKDKKKD